MNKKVGIGIGIFATVGIVGGLLGWWLSRSEPVDLGKDFSEQPNLEILENENNDEEYVGNPVPVIINRAGTIKKVKKSYVVINGPEDEDISIYIDDDTEIYGPDGSEKNIDDLKVGMYITVDIDGDLRDSDAPNDEFDAMIIYISGK
ncbi:MAG: hypothetical protein IJ272_10710 [Clostridia bacterium]|nr:hypothetical protein [Clostridia bacterium]